MALFFKVSYIYTYVYIYFFSQGRELSELHFAAEWNQGEGVGSGSDKLRVYTWSLFN